jgi:DNA-binding CsgD family transcriptional regulator
MESPRFITSDKGRLQRSTVCGDGLPVVFMPTWRITQEAWSANSVGWLLTALAARYRVVNYDSRGMGMSTRGLPGNVSLESYFLDLEAVVERLRLNRFVLIGSHNSALVAARYAVKFPDRVAALVLNNSGLAWPGVQVSSLRETMARESWEAFLYSVLPSSYTLEVASRSREKFARWITQEDYLAALDVWRNASLEDVVSHIRTPTLVLKPRHCPHAKAECAVELARLLPNGRIVLLESDWPFGEPVQALDAIDSFLAELRLVVNGPSDTPSQAPGLAAGLSARQAQVLRLIAEGKTNGEIADELVISLRTVERHVAELYAKIGVRNRVEAAAFAMHQLVKA